MQSFMGKGVGRLVAMGRLKLWTGSPSVQEAPLLSAGEELKRFEEAKALAGKELEDIYERALREVGQEEADIVCVQQMLLEDLDFVETVEQCIGEGAVAEKAVQQAAGAIAEMYLASGDEYTMGRAADVRDIGNRLLRCLSGGILNNWDSAEPVVLVADDLYPSETLQLPKDKLLGFVTAGGSVSSHTAILAKNLGIPAVVAVGTEAAKLAGDGTEIIVDAAAGKVIVNPDEETKAHYQGVLKAQAKQKKLLEKLKGLPAETRSGRSVRLYANIGSVEDAEQAVANDAEGIGLFRSEFLYLKGDEAPTEEQQVAAYQKVLRLMGGKEVIIRTLDIGADKQASYLDLPKEENPALGCRAIRLCYNRPELFRTQLRALCRASVAGELSIMVPMIISEKEVSFVKGLLKEVKAELKAEKLPYNSHIRLGIMIETPAAALCSDRLAKKVDFFSIGTNDLTQYTLAIDRQNAALEPFLDRHHPAVLQLMEMTVKNAHAAGITVGICGELGADERLTKNFLEWGVDELSVAPGGILPLRKRIRSFK